MIIEEIRNIKSARSDLRKFGVLMAVVIGLLGAMSLWRGKSYHPHLLVVSVMFLVSGLCVPAILKHVYRAWMSGAVVLGWVVTRLILLILFYAVLTPIGLLTRLLRKELLSLRFESGLDTYWTAKDKAEDSNESYERQY